MSKNESFIRKVPGFRSGKKWKMALASFVYFMVIMGVLASLTDSSYTPSQTKQGIEESIINSSLESMLPTVSDMPTEFKVGEIKSLDYKYAGFLSGRSLEYTKVVGKVMIGVIGVTFFVENYESINDSVNQYNKYVNEIKSKGGYTLLNTYNDCFAYKSEYGLDKVGQSICRKSNIIFTTEVGSTQTTEGVDKYIISMSRIFDSKIR